MRVRRHPIGHLAVMLLWSAACGRIAGCGPGSVAQLLEAHGRVERDFKDSVGRWQGAKPQAEFFRGDGLRTSARSAALLRVGRGGKLRVESDTLLRFAAPSRATPDAAPGVDVETGSAMLESTDAELSIRTRSGSARLRPGTRVQLQPTERGQRFTVLIGGADFKGDDGKTVALGAGQSVFVGIGLAVLDESAAKPERHVPTQAGGASEGRPPPEPATLLAAVEAHPDPVAVEASEPARPQPARAEPQRGETKDRPDLSARVGQSFRVYDPAPPTAVALNLASECGSEGGELRIAGRPPLRDDRRFVVLLPAGMHRYAVHCLSQGAPAANPSASGSVLVIKSDGTRPLPSSAASNSVDTDGRKYTLMYQNLKPIVNVRWPSAPSAPGYVLQVQTPSGEHRSFRAKTPRYTLEPSSLSDGVYTLQFEASGRTSSHSKPTRIELAFDNAAPTASLQQPPPQGFAPGSSIPLVGVAVAGSRAFVEGRALHLDAQQRFNTRLELSPGDRSFAIRFQNPKHGIRYYVRRAIGFSR